MSDFRKLGNALIDLDRVRAILPGVSDRHRLSRPSTPTATRTQSTTLRPSRRSPGFTNASLVSVPLSRRRVLMFDWASRLQAGRVLNGWMLLLEIKNDCYLACRETDEHPRVVYFIHVTWDNDAEKWGVIIPAQED